MLKTKLTTVNSRKSLAKLDFFPLNSEKIHGHFLLTLIIPEYAVLFNKRLIKLAKKPIFAPIMVRKTQIKMFNMVYHNIIRLNTDKQLITYPYLAEKYFFRYNKHNAVKVFLAMLLLLLTINISAQVFTPKWSAGMHSGMLVFYGDIKTNEFLPSVSGFNELRFGVGIHANYHFNPMLAMRGSIIAGKLAGAKPEADEYFEANILDYTLQAMINLNGLFFYDYDITPLDVYFIIGYGLVDFRTIRRKLSDDSFIRAFGYNADGSKSDRKTREMVIPVGIMLQSNIENLLNLNNYLLSNIDLTLEFVLHNANTNKLDANLTVREVRDKYSYLALGLVYYLN